MNTVHILHLIHFQMYAFHLYSRKIVLEVVVKILLYGPQLKTTKSVKTNLNRLLLKENSYEKKFFMNNLWYCHKSNKCSKFRYVLSCYHNSYKLGHHLAQVFCCEYELKSVQSFHAFQPKQCVYACGFE